MNKATYKHHVTSFWSKVLLARDPRECLIWGGSYGSGGYGQITIDGHKFLAHRLAYMLANDQGIDDDLVILHECDRPSCVNPLHLTAGSHQENMADRTRKDRKNSYNRVRTQGQIDMILELYIGIRKDGYRNKDYAVEPISVQKICNTHGFDPVIVDGLLLGYDRKFIIKDTRKERLLELEFMADHQSDERYKGNRYGNVTNEWALNARCKASIYHHSKNENPIENMKKFYKNTTVEGFINIFHRLDWWK